LVPFKKQYNPGFLPGKGWDQNSPVSFLTRFVVQTFPVYKKIILKKAAARNVIRGHPWIFSGAILSRDDLDNGELCDVFCEGVFVGTGYFNRNTDIAARILSRAEERIDAAFFAARFRELRTQRETWIKGTNAWRAVHGESDGIPGLIVDKYDHTLVVQFHTLGIERLGEEIVSALAEVYRPRCIYRKDAPHGARIEGMESRPARALLGELDEEIVISENGFNFAVNAARGQKTGFFLDQRENRKSLLSCCAGRTVLNCFAYTGGFSVYAASVARRVTSVDASADALEGAKKNFRLNGLDPERHEFVVADVFEYFKTVRAGQFDAIILDPPSFARKRGQVKQAIRAYTTINSKALEKLPPGGVLATSSCTTHVDELTFLKILHQSSTLARSRLKILHSAAQPFDHPYHLSFPEGRYLKFFILVKE
jgi:23S rRNA (cytosine1962-C5)-methyltransferase